MKHPLEELLDSWMEMLDTMQDDMLARPHRMSKDVRMDAHSHMGDWENRNGEIAITVDMPGVQKEDIQVTVDKHMVKVRAKTEDRNYNFDKEFNSFTTTLDPDNVVAKFNNGVLDITIQKAEESQGKQIAIE